MSRPDATVVMPTRGRAARAAACVERLLHVSRGYDVKVIVVTDDPATMAACMGRDRHVLFQVERTTAPVAWNAGAACATSDVLVLGADDLWFGHGWIGETLDRMQDFPDGAGLIGFNDLARDGRELATHWAVQRAFAQEHLGGILYPPCYQHCFGDNEVTARAKAAGRFIWAQCALVEHRHPAFAKAAVDDLYVEKLQTMDADRALFAWRQEHGFPDTWKPVLE
jgi:glycosyltransferase involved in cell wall biosynthesis